MTDSRDEDVFLADGGDWAEHEDCLIGNESGLRSLGRAIETALDEGEYYGDDLGEWLGVKLVDDPADESSTSSDLGFVGSILATVIVLLFLSAIGVGFWTILGWILG